MTGLLANNPARAFFDELDEMGDLFARLDLVPHKIESDLTPKSAP